MLDMTLYFGELFTNTKTMNPSDIIWLLFFSFLFDPIIQDLMCKMLHNAIKDPHFFQRKKKCGDRGNLDRPT